MTGFLRFVGLLNAAVWCGSSIFLALALPAVFTPELKRLLTAAGVGFAAEAILARYFILQYCCAVVALAHLAAEWFYFGRRWPRIDVVLISIVLFIAMVGGLWLQPKMRAWHVTKYFGATLEQQAQAAHLFGIWHGISEFGNLIAMICLIWFLARAGKVQEPARFVTYSKMRS